MSDYIPFEIQSEIIKRLPVKSVVQCRSVSKLWKSLIDSAEFIKSYHSCKTPKQHLFVRYKLANDLKYVSIADDDIFPNQKSSLTVPQPISQLGYISTLNSANGLLCFYGSRQDVFDEKIVVLWNPSIGKAVDRLVRSTNELAVPKVYESLGLFEYYNDGETRFCDIRIMKEGVTKSFTKMLSIKAPDSLVSYRVLKLRKNGEVIIENIDDTNSSAIEVYSDNLVI
ncbi:F-box domain containing protein [Tanacetum coccineum]